MLRRIASAWVAHLNIFRLPQPKIYMGSHSLLQMVLIAAVVIASSASAQPPGPKPGAMREIEPDHYFLKYSFSLDHNKKAREVADKKLKDKKLGDELEATRAAELGLSLADLKQVDKVLDKLEQDAKVVENKIKSHLDEAKSKKINKDIAFLRKLESDRYATIVFAMHSLYKSLSPAAGEALRRHLNQTYRQRMSVPGSN